VHTGDHHQRQVQPQGAAPHPGLGDHLGAVIRRGGRNGLADGGRRLCRVGRIPVGSLPPLRRGECSGQDAADAANRTGLHRVTDVWPAPGAAAVLARPRPLPGARQHEGGDPATVGLWPRRARIRPSAASASRARRATPVPMPLQGAQPGDRGQFVVPPSGMEGICLPFVGWEPVIGFEPMACRLQELRPRAPCALAAQMTRVIALMALTALGLTEAPVHEPVHG
jgi:hypothetical protein